MPRSPCRRIILTGVSPDSLGPFAAMLQASCASRITVSPDSAFATVPSPDAVIVTTDPVDVLRLKKMRDWTPQERADCQVVFVIRDPRDLLLARRDWAGGAFGQGYDHALHISSKQVVTLTGLGLLYLQDVLERMAGRDPAILVLRHEDIETRPELVRAALSQLTGLDFRRAFQPAATPEWPAAARGYRARNAAGTLSEEERGRLARQFRLAPELFGILDRWDYEAPGDRRWHAELERASPGALDDAPGLIIGYHTTDPLYTGEARRMRASVEKLNLPLEVEPVDPAGSWLSGVQIKPAWLAAARRRLRGPLLYIDVDAVLHADPWPYLRAYDGDVAVAGHHDQVILSGTVLINDTPGAQQFLDEWADEQRRSPEAWDQVCLETVAKRHRLGGQGVCVQYLPPEMCCVFNRKFSPPIVAVIEHLQASREQFSEATDDELVRNLDLRRRRLEELEDGRDAAPVLSPPGPQNYADLTPTERGEATRRLLASGQTDRNRWAQPVNLKSAWSSRAEVVAALIAPGSRVLDMGCGAMDLEAVLPERCAYIPADIVPRDARTILIDLNEGLLPTVDAEVVTLLGVLEYVHHPEVLFRALSERWPRIVMTYNPGDLDAGRDRHSHGWFNALSSAALVAMADGAGYRLEMIVPHGSRERVFDFTRKAAPLCP